MKYIALKSALLSLLILLAIAGCKKDPPVTEDPFNPTPYNLVLPTGFPPMLIPEFNQMTVEAVELGRKLYYDTILSTNGRSCSSCHRQSDGFSASFLGPGGFSIPPHVNLGWKPAFTWIGWEELLDHVAIVDLEVPEFFAPDMEILLERLRAHEQYQDMFKKAFNIDIVEVNVEKRKLYISKAIAQFMRTLISGNSKFDRVMRGEEFFTYSEMNGYTLFFNETGDCFHCHGSYPLFTNNDFHNIGLNSDFSNDRDKGLILRTGNPADMGKFMTPTLRNIEVTGPYMHDGRFKTLEEVIEFYNSQIQNSSTLDPIMTKPGKELGLQLTEQEKTDLINFLKTLTDEEFLTNPEFSNPH